MYLLVAICFVDTRKNLGEAFNFIFVGATHWLLCRDSDSVSRALIGSNWKFEILLENVIEIRKFH